MKKIPPTYIIIGLTLVVFFVTKNPYTAAFRLQIAMAVLLGLVGYLVATRKKVKGAALYYLLTATVLSLVAATGWFFSPFFFSLYLLAVVLAFVFPLPASLGFVATLVGLFSFNVGEVDLAYDFLVVLSLITVIPVSIYLRKEYLKLKENEKEILVLKHQQQEAYKSVIEEVLSNTLEKFAENIRQPINDVKQLAVHMADHREKAELDKHLKEMAKLADEAMLQLKQFEEEATGNKLARTKQGV